MDPSPAGAPLPEHAETRTEERVVVVDARGPRTQEELFLHAFATQAEVIRYMRKEPIEADRARLPQILLGWNEQQPHVQELQAREAGWPDDARSAPIPDDHADFVRTVAEHPLFLRTFQHLPFRFALLPVDTLVAPQRTVNLTFVRQLRARYQVGLGTEDLFRICLTPERPAEPIEHLESGRHGHLFSSPVTDLRFLGTAVREVTADEVRHPEAGGLPRAAVVAYVGFGCATVNVFQIGKRYILNNGFHRVYALRALGVREIPALVQRVQNVALELPEQILGLPSRYLVGSPRPVLMKDFFEPGFTVTVRVRERLHVVRVSVSPGRYEVPVA